MSAIIPLGKFERISLRDAWPTEDGNFTPWLAEQDSIALLGIALNIELEVEAVEYRVGSFKADILARAVDEAEHRVIIENQFGRTDHGHLGQILTYLAGVEGAKTIVWIAEDFQDDHRAAIEWLNTNTGDDFSFFAVEIELWRIDGSAAAPRFNVKISPNDWARDARSAVRRVEETVLTDSHRINQAYWASFAEFLKAQGSTFNVNPRAKEGFRAFSVGRAGFTIYANISSELRKSRVELFVLNDANKSIFKALEAQKASIEKDFGEPLSWQELPDKKGSKIALEKEGVDPADESQYPALHQWMLEKLTAFRRVFAPRVKALNIHDDENVELPKERQAN